MTLDHYIIDENGVITKASLMKWARWLESEKGHRDRRIGYDKMEEVDVSTVFMGLDHGWGDDTPVLFETMVFNGINKPVEDYTARYHTLEEAREGHKRVVEEVKKEKFFWVCEICKEARPDSKISVLSYHLKDLPGAERNLRYCNDKSECVDGAKEKSLTQLA